MLRSYGNRPAYWHLRCAVPSVYLPLLDALHTPAQTHSCGLAHHHFLGSLVRNLDSQCLSYYPYLRTHCGPAAPGNMQDKFESLEGALAEVVGK